MEKPEKPKMQRKVAVVWEDEGSRRIRFWADPDVAKELSRYGGLVHPAGNPSEYTLTVDARFDFNEVAKYIRALG